MWTLDSPAAVEGALAALPEGAPVYLSIDVDAFDPAVLPGTSSPEPDGLTYAALTALVRGAIARNRVVGVDVVELAPTLDPSGNSALLVARLVMDVLAAVFDP
jgi:agmatinase